MVVGLTSAAGVIALLDDDEIQLKEYALARLDGLVDDHWPEISESVSKIEILSEDRTFPKRELASLVASKVYYNLGSYDDSLTFALGAGTLFDVDGSSQYIDTLISKCIDRYKDQRMNMEQEAGEGSAAIDPRLESVVDRMFERCLKHGKMRQVAGVALDTRRLDILERAIVESPEQAVMLDHCFHIAITFVESRRFLKEVLHCLAKLYSNLPMPDYLNMCYCYVFLNEPQAVADILEKLLRNNDSMNLGRVTAFQISFDLYQIASQQFLGHVIASLESETEAAVTEEAKTTEERPAGEQATASEGTDEAKDETKSETKSETTAEGDDKMEVDVVSKEKGEGEIAKIRLLSILNGDRTNELYHQFLIRMNCADLLVLRQVKEKVHNSICHTATLIANSFMHCGTTSDTFLREDLEWLAQASNWAKFIATASLGVIHKFHESRALYLMQKYLPADSSNTSGYQDGGGLYAVGLIHANHGGNNITQYLLRQLRGAANEVIRHGACLGLGLAAMGTAKTDVYDELKFCLFNDDAVAGEAAGIAMGLVMVGSHNEMAINDMVNYARQTQHEKIIRGLSIGIALIVYGLQEEADSLIEDLVRDKDPILRRSGMFCIAMAYCGTGNNRAIKHLLHVGVSDANDDVRRAAVTAIGFILLQCPERCRSVVSLLSSSYNPHVRCGSAMALGIAHAGSGSKDAMAIIEPLFKDSANFVRQGSYIAAAMVMVAQSQGSNPKVAPFRETLRKVVRDSHEDSMTKFGAILAQGIVDAGGRNATIAFLSSAGRVHMKSVVGALIFQSFWFWYPLTHFMSLAFRPSAVICLNRDLKMPVLEIKSSAKPSMFAYPPLAEAPKEKEKEKVATAVLSTTAKAKAKEAKKKAEAAVVEEPMEVEAPKDQAKQEEKSADGEKKSDEEGKKAEKEAEPEFQMLENPARVLQPQLKVISLESSQYKPTKPLSTGGIILLQDVEVPSEDEQLVKPVAAGGPELDEGPEPEPPQPFEWAPPSSS